MSVHKDKNSSWYVKYKNKTKRGFKTKRLAQQYEAKLKLSIISIKENVMLYTVIDDYLECVKSRITHGSFMKIERIMIHIIKGYFPNKNMENINEIDCRDFKDYISTLNYATVTKNCILNYYKLLFKHASIYFQIKNNPTYVLENFKKSFEEKKAVKNRELNIWDESEFKVFINQVDNMKYKYLFILLYYTGMRIGEALALNWSDFNNDSISISKSLTRKTNNGIYEIKETKTVQSIRTISLGNNLSTILKEYKDKEMKIAGFNNDWFIFGRLKPLSTTNVARAKDKAIKLSNVRKIRIHDFRHSHASNLIANGISVVSVSKRLGHSNINLTLGVYTHLLNNLDEDISLYIDKSSQNLLNKQKKPLK